MAAVPDTVLVDAVAIPRNFVMNEVPSQPETPTPASVDTAPPLGPLSAFTGAFVGRGFNTIFRPQNNATPTQLPHPQPDSDNILELNLTTELLSFASPLGTVPNRGAAQGDIKFNGVPYLQSISDITDPKIISAIHLEPGLWIFVPATTAPPVTGPTVVRMASIPHGSTINAQGSAEPQDGPPTFTRVDITPFQIGQPDSLISFPSQTVANGETPRIPQDLSTTPDITQELLDNPNLLLQQHNQGLTIVSTVVVTIDTHSAALPGGGTANIGFLVGDGSNPNADAVHAEATFWIETVTATVSVPPTATGGHRLVPLPAPEGAPRRNVRVVSAAGTTAPQDVTVSYTQIQYSQTVLLNFKGLSWPHVSVATLVPDLSRSTHVSKHARGSVVAKIQI